MPTVFDQHATLAVALFAMQLLDFLEKSRQNAAGMQIRPSKSSFLTPKEREPALTSISCSSFPFRHAKEALPRRQLALEAHAQLHEHMALTVASHLNGAQGRHACAHREALEADAAKGAGQLLRQPAAELLLHEAGQRAGHGGP